MRPTKLALKWTDLLFEEFWQQGDLEKSQNLEVSFMCDRETTETAKGQEGFINFCPMPLFQSVSQILPQIKQVQIKTAQQNIKVWNLI